jgi:predicted porin
MERENRESGAKADYFIGAGEVTWIASPRLAFFAKYRHKEADIDNPDSITFANVCAPSNNPSNTYACFIKPSISSITNTVSGTARFRVTSGITLRAEFSYENIDRKDAAEWFVPDSTTRKVASLSADIRIARNAKLMAKYTHQDTENPETNIEPDHSDEGRISFTWAPLPGLSTLLSYRVAKESRGALQFVQQDPVTSVEFLAESPDKRDALRDRFLGSITYLVLKDLSLTASYSYIHNKVKEDLAFNDTSGNLLFDPRVPETDTAHSYSLDANYLPKNNIALTAGVSYTVSSGAFFPADINLTQPVSIASFSELKTRETVYSVSGEYRFKNGFSAGIRYGYTVFDDVLDNPFDDVNDGKAHIVLLTLSKKW